MPEIEFKKITKKITAPRETERMSFAFSTHPNAGPDPTKTPSILNTTLPGPQNPNQASVSIVSSSSQTSTIYARSTSDMETATVISRKHLDSGYIDKSSAGKFESTSEEIDEIPSKQELTFTDVTSATESTTESVQSLPEASSVDIDLPPGVDRNVIQKLRQHETPIQANDESFPNESTKELKTSSFTNVPLVFIDDRNFEVSEAIEESLDLETNIKTIVDKANENKNENSQFDSSQMPGLSDSELSSSQGINLSSIRDPPANMDEIQLPNLDSVQVPVVVDPHIAPSPHEYEDFYSPWSSDKGAYESSFTQLSDPSSDEYDNDWDFIQVPVDLDVKSNMDNDETEHLSDEPVVISISQEKSRTPFYYIPDYDISNYQIVEPSMQWISSKESSSIAPPTSTTKTTSTTTKTTTISKEPETKSTTTTTSTLISKSETTESSIPTSKTTAISTTIRTTASKIISTTSEIETTTEKSALTTTTLPTSTTTARETTLPTTLSATEIPKKLAKVNNQTTSTTTSTTTTITSSSTSMSLTTTQMSTTSAFTTTTTSTTTRSRTIKLISMMPTASTKTSSFSPIPKSKMNKTGSLKPAPTFNLSTTSVLNVAVKENYKKTKLPVIYISSTIPPASRLTESTFSSSSTTSSRKNRHKKHQKQHHDRRVSRKERKQIKQEEAEISTPKNAAAFKKSPLSRDFSSQKASTTSDAMHSTMPQM